MTTGKDTAHVCLGDGDVKVGDTIDFYRNVCNSRAGNSKIDPDISGCKMKILGSGKITRLINSHYSEVKTEGNFEVKEGLLVQKR